MEVNDNGCATFEIFKESIHNIQPEKTFGYECSPYGIEDSCQLPAGKEEATNGKALSFTAECYSVADGYNGVQDGGYIDQNGCRTSIKDYMVDIETVDTVLGSTTPTEQEFPIETYMANVAPTRYASQDSMAFSDATATVDAHQEVPLPTIRLKTVSDATPKNNSNHSRHTEGSYGAQLSEQMDANYLRHLRSNDFVNHIDDFMRDSSELCRPVSRNFTRSTPDPKRVRINVEGSYDMPISTPTALRGEDKLNNRQCAPSARTSYFYGSESANCDSDLFFTPTLTNRSSDMKKSFSVPSNYCVYVGCDSNSLSCECNMLRPCGGNCHVSVCHLVTSELEPSTEHWPVSGSSHLQSLVKTLDRVVEEYKGSSPMTIIRQTAKSLKERFWSKKGRGPYGDFKETVVSNMPDYEKWSKTTSVVTPATEETPAPDFYVQTSYEDSPYDMNIMMNENNSAAKKRNKSKRPRTGFAAEGENSTREEYSGCVASKNAPQLANATETTQYNTPKANNRGGGVHHNGEKVSGVWYDTNRHLWRVVYMKGNKRKTQGFSSIKLGYEEARRKAIETRYKMVVLNNADKV
ncbi:AP2 [Babesia gibsoni]|uniref:AP2 n=1 Tax=Babesia gibsoni TaxID=33632 RepID=A0AAD8USW0_BABGI|nr:AP2 [Babesia gibsoni]